MKNRKLNIFLILFMISISLFLLIFFKVDLDYFWHIKAGEYMFKNGPITHDVFSWIIKGKYWMSHEWMFEIILFILKKIFGNLHTIIYCFICLISLFLLLYFSNKKNIQKNIPFTLVYFSFFVLLSVSFIQARPYMISFIFVCISIYFLYDLYKNKESKKIYFLPLISIVWANIHGGSSNMGYLLCLLFYIFGLFSFKYKKIESNRLSKKQLNKYLLVMFLCMIGVCINIHGFKMFLYPYTNMLDSTMINNIMEWQSTSLNNIFHYSYFLFILIIFLVLLFSDKKIELIDLVLFGLCVYLGLKSVRFWLYTPIIMNYVIFNYVNNTNVNNSNYGFISIICIFLVGCFIFNFNRIVNIKYKTNIDNKLVDIINKESPKRLFNMYDYGGELIYNNIYVFVDGRADLYSKYNYKDYLNISKLKDDYVKLINKYDFDYLLVNSNYPINTYLNYNDNYEVIYKNKNILLYKKIVN